MTARKVLISMLKHAHAGEIAAVAAYQGHIKSLKDPEEQKKLYAIIKEERHHIFSTNKMLNHLGSKPSKIQDAAYFCIGTIIGWLCHVATWRQGMWGAGFIERIGVQKYREMSDLARKCGMPWMWVALREMENTEKQHEEYFKKKLSRNKL